MLSFPAQNWKTAINRVTNQPRNGAAGPRNVRCASQIKERLYLSDYWTANNDEEMEKLGITHVISVMDIQLPLPYQVIPDKNRLLVAIADRSDVDILVHLEKTTKFIINALKENETNKVVVHCLQGISRSATVVCAYLIATEGMAAHEAVDYVQSVRNVVCPNLGFRLQLVQYGERIAKPVGKGQGNPLGKEFMQRFRKLLSPTVPAVKPTPPLPIVST